MKNTKMIEGLIQAGVIAALVMVAMPELGFADTGSGLGETTTKIATNQLKGLPNLITAICYIAGIVLMIGGVLQLRTHAENPSQAGTLNKGIARLVVGGVLAALPSFTGWLNTTMSFNGSAVTYNNALSNQTF